MERAALLLFVLVVLAGLVTYPLFLRREAARRRVRDEARRQQHIAHERAWQKTHAHRHRNVRTREQKR